MYYDNQVIYGNTKYNGTFAWNGETYYKTPSGQCKKITKDGRKIKIDCSLWDELEYKYKLAFGIK